MFSFFLVYCSSLIISEPGLMDFSLEPNGTVSLDLSNQFFNLFLFAADLGTNVTLTQPDNSSLEGFTDQSIFVSTTALIIKNNNPYSLYIMIWTGPYNICPNKGILLYSTKTAYFNGLLDEGMSDFCIFNIGGDKIMTEIAPKITRETRITFYRISDIVGQTTPYNCNGCDFESSIPYFISVSYKGTEKNEIEVTLSGKQRTLPKDCQINSIPILQGNKAIENDSLKVKIRDEECGFLSLSSDATLIITIVFCVLVGMIVLIALITFIVKCARKPNSIKTREEKEVLFIQKEKKESVETPLNGFQIDSEINENNQSHIEDETVENVND